ncbi:class I SAM-dependent methyltransferase [Phyllobacterium zundukense]|uniref:Class I SAM-dependent methyltransferase n=1 Tax=Phyllobacterium zundukense TaxID=1867719 RepID=A0ACD4CZC9_9HYPH|nr:class I SAM-dependent methyltransferase [Phyllobacterium zundukense]UXN58946.1 class I SAM-dependent methyltransferase [Phyllobacterium zundukense]
MLITFADRYEMIATLGNGPLDTMVELGVYKGEFADFCSQKITPNRHYLIDFWDYDRYEFVLKDAPQNLERQAIFESYFDNEPRETLSRAQLQVEATFSNRSNTKIIKADIAAAAVEFPDNFFDVIYLDGNHTYEFVLRDLYTWYPKLKSGGLFVCNDYFESSFAAKQNIGVIPAFQTFSQRFEVHPIMLSMTEWSDFYFSNQPHSPLISRLIEGLINTGQNLLEIPSDFLGSYHHSAVKITGGQILLPVFGKGK